MTTTTTTTTTTNIEDLHPDVVARALRLLDGPGLAAVSCATTYLRSLAAQPDVWRELCLSTWPSLQRNSPILEAIISSFPDSHRSFFSQAYPSPFSDSKQSTGDDTHLPGELISAVDIYYKGIPICSRVMKTETSSQWFQGSPFRIDVLDRKDPALMESTPVLSPAELTLSWIVIDPAGRKAVNLSSRKPVAVERHWYTGETMVRFAMVTGDGSAVAAAAVVVTRGEETEHVKEVSMVLEDEDGVCLNGKQSLVIIKEAMEGAKRGRGRGEEEMEAQRRYEELLQRRKERKESRARTETRIDTCCIAIGVSLFLSFLILVVFR